MPPPGISQSAMPAAAPARPAESGVITAEGRVVPAQRTTLAFQVAGRIVFLAVQEGDSVKAGTVLARLDDTLLRAQLAQAQAAIALAQKQLALVRDGGTAEQIASAQATLKAAEANYDKVRKGPTADQLALLKANVDNAKAALDQAQSAYDRVGGASNPMIGLARESLQLQQATNTYNAAIAAFNDARSHPTDSELAAAYSQTQQAKQALALLTPTQSSIDVARAQVDQAMAALASAQASAQDAVLRAPFDGTVGTISVDNGQVVSPGTPVMSLGALPNLQVETTDLAEADVTKIAVGQVADVTCDALPGKTLRGQVVRIAPEATVYRGDQVYKVTIDLSGSSVAGLRWGMTANVMLVPK